MVNLAKLLHSAFGVESPRAFVILFAISGAIAFGVVGYLVSREYKEDLRRQESKATPIAAPIAPAPAPQTQPKPQKKTKAKIAATPPPILAITPTEQADRPAAVRVKGKSHVDSADNITATGGYDGVVTEDESTVGKISNVFVGPHETSGFEVWRARLIEHAGNPPEIEKDIAWYREQRNIAMASLPQEQREACLASMKNVEERLMRVASDKAATIDLVKNHIRAAQQK
jgi:hypothetical protein